MVRLRVPERFFVMVLGGSGSHSPKKRKNWSELLLSKMPKRPNQPVERMAAGLVFHAFGS